MPKNANAEILAAIAALKGVVEGVVKDVESLKKPKIEVKAAVDDKVVAATPAGDPAYPIPTEFRTLTDTILNKNFGIRVEPLSDSPAFQFVVVVPDKYSNMPAPAREMYKYDLRPKVITYAEGKNGVKDWLEKVYNNFSNETKAQIVSDRNG